MCSLIVFRAIIDGLYICTRVAEAVQTFVIGDHAVSTLVIYVGLSVEPSRYHVVEDEEPKCLLSLTNIIVRYN